MRRSALRAWQGIHTWSSLIGSALLLVICVTGLPLIFAEEIEYLSDPPQAYQALSHEARPPSLDALAAKARRLYPNHVITSAFVDDAAPQVYIWMAPSFTALRAAPETAHFLRFDARTAEVIGRSRHQEDRRLTFMDWMLRLHVDLFAGLAGALFMGVMGLLLIAAIVSGTVLYGPFTRKLDFGVIRAGRSRRTYWLDLHNLLGIVTLAWGTVVGATGVINELSMPLYALWQQTDVQTILEPWRGNLPPRPSELSSPQAALETASRTLPDMKFTTIDYPGSEGGNPHHYLVWGNGRTALTRHLASPVLVDARTGRLTAIIAMPWYLRLLEVSRPLHFGDYGGLPLKIIWGLLDIVTIVVLGSGVYLWFTRARRDRAGHRALRARFAGLELAE